MSGPPGGPDVSVVAVVSSAGGLTATSTVLAALPHELPAAVVTLQHMEPGRVSELPHLLAQSSRLPVEAARDGEALRPGRVVVAPPGWHTLVDTGPSVALIRSGMHPPSRPSADLLLTTLAMSVGVHAIAVVLSGTGHDGATGVSAIKRWGGVVIASDEATSAHFGMPRAAMQREVIDHVLPLDDIAAAVLSHLARAAT